MQQTESVQHLTREIFSGELKNHGKPFTPISNEKNTTSVPRMNAKVEKKINGLSVSASPIFKGGVLPAYWTCSINDHMLPKIFKSAHDVFRFVKNFKRY